LALGMVPVWGRVVAVSNTIHKTNHHRQGTVFHGNCTLEHHQLLTSNGYNHRLWCPHNSLGNLCNCPCNMIHTLECQFCKSLGLPQLASLARPILESIAVVEPKVLQLQQVASSLLAVAPDSSTPDSPNHHLPCKLSRASCMVEHRQTPSNIPHRCHPCALHNSLCILRMCLVCPCPDHSKVHKQGWHIDLLAAVE